MKIYIRIDLLIFIFAKMFIFYNHYANLHFLLKLDHFFYFIFRFLRNQHFAFGQSVG